MRIEVGHAVRII